MKIYSGEIETSIQMLKFCSDSDLIFSPVFTFPSSEERISFTALIEIKQTKEFPEKNLNLFLFHLVEQHDDPSDDFGIRLPQHLSQLELGSFQLFDIDSQSNQIEHLSVRLEKDPWVYRRLFRWNLENVPHHGVGKYVLALTVPSENDGQKMTLLNCAYFEVK